MLRINEHRAEASMDNGRISSHSSKSYMEFSVGIADIEIKSQRHSNLKESCIPSVARKRHSKSKESHSVQNK